MRQSNEESTFIGFARVKKATSGAFLLDFDGTQSDTWIPRSQLMEESDIHDRSEVGDEGDVYVPEWLAIERGLA